jgi:hypothetical protein
MLRAKDEALSQKDAHLKVGLTSTATSSDAI